MAFNIFSSEQNGIQLVNLSNEENHTLISVAPAFGAMLHEFSVVTKEGRHNVIDNYAGKAQIEKELATSFKSSKLSPFVCRTANGKYLYDGVDFEFNNKFIDGNAIHGLLYNKPFVRVDGFADEQKAAVLFKYNYKEDDEGYPFVYRCEIKYTLFPQDVLQIQTTVINLDELEIPMADGWHPYFTLGGKINDWLLYFNAAAMVEFDARLLPTGQLTEFDTFNKETLIGNLQLDNCFILDIPEQRASCILRNPANGLELSLFPNDTYKYLQVYTPPHRTSIAIENLSAAPDAFNNKMGLLMLQPRHTHTFTVYYQLCCK